MSTMPRDLLPVSRWERSSSMDGERVSKTSRKPTASCLNSTLTRGWISRRLRAAAFQFQDILKSLGLTTFPMLTGGKGVHVIAPLPPQAEWPEVKAFASGLAQAVAQTDHSHFTTVLSKAKRKGRIFVDYLRNQRGATAIMPYSARSRPGAPVAAPSPGRR